MEKHEITLDRAIELMDAQVGELGVVTGVCLYAKDIRDYLKEYRTTQTAYIRAMADLEDNPPLTWDELRQMEGKPVYVIYHTFKTKGWVLVDYVDDDRIDFTLPSAMRLTVFEHQLGKIWQAYRKERNEQRI